MRWFEDGQKRDSSYVGKRLVSSGRTARDILRTKCVDEVDKDMRVVGVCGS